MTTKKTDYMLKLWFCNSGKLNLNNLHFLLRYSDKITQVDTINEHVAVLNSKQAVWMGKFGVGISKKFYDIAKAQIKNNEELNLYLMKGTQYTHKAQVVDIEMGANSKSELYSLDKNLTPSYYRNKRCSLWFKLSSINCIDENELNKLWLYNSPNSHPSISGMRGLIYLTYRIGQIEKNKSKNSGILYTGGLFD